MANEMKVPSLGLEAWIFVTPWRDTCQIRRRGPHGSRILHRQCLYGQWIFSLVLMKGPVSEDCC